MELTKIDRDTYSKLTPGEIRKLKKACKIASPNGMMTWQSMAIRPASALDLIHEVETRNGIKL